MEITATPRPSKTKYLLQYILHDGQRVGFALQYDAKLIDAIRAIFQEYRGVWRKSSRAWVVPKGAAEEVIDALHDLVPGRFPQKRAHDFLKRAAQKPHPFVAPQLELQIQPLVDGRQAIRFAYDPVLVVLLHKLRGHWHKPWWVLDVPLDKLQEHIEKLGAIPRDCMTVQPHLWEMLEGGTLQPTGLLHIEDHPIEPERGDTAFGGASAAGPAVLVPLVAPLSLLEVHTDQVRTLAETYGLYPYQAEGLHFLLARSTALLADDMGLGKTRQAIVAALAVLEAHTKAHPVDEPPLPSPAAQKSSSLPTSHRVLIVCPASLKRNWENELKALGIPDQAILRVESLKAARVIDQSGSVMDDSPQNPENPLGTADLESVRFIIVNYELLKALEGHYLLAIFDEAHYLKEPGARRTQEAFRLAQRIARCWLLTATPMLNREDELWTLLRLGGHPMGALSLPDFRSLYAGDAEQRTLLNDRLQEWMLRRHKQEVLSLPGKYHQTITVSPDAEWMADYQKIHQNHQLRAIEKNYPNPYPSGARKARYRTRFTRQSSGICQSISLLSVSRNRALVCGTTR